MREPAQPLLHVDNVTVQYKTEHKLITAVYRVNFKVLKSDRYVLLGSSGCGKSTLLKAIGGFMQVTEGCISLHGRKVTDPGPDRVMVFQEFDQLLPWKTVQDNIVFALTASGRASHRMAREAAQHYVAKVGLAAFADSYPHMLSGGMKARVAIARAMAMEPDVLLMDEPFAALDAFTRRKMQDDLLELWEELRFTILFVTHSIPEAIKVGSRILLLSPHPGRVRAELASSGHDTAGPDGIKRSEQIERLLFGTQAGGAETIEPRVAHAG